MCLFSKAHNFLTIVQHQCNHHITHETVLREKKTHRSSFIDLCHEIYQRAMSMFTLSSNSMTGASSHPKRFLRGMFGLLSRIRWPPISSPGSTSRASAHLMHACTHLNLYQFITECAVCVTDPDQRSPCFHWWYSNRHVANLMSTCSIIGRRSERFTKPHSTIASFCVKDAGIERSAIVIVLWG